MQLDRKAEWRENVDGFMLSVNPLPPPTDDLTGIRHSLLARGSLWFGLVMDALHCWLCSAVYCFGGKGHLAAASEGLSSDPSRCVCFPWMRFVFGTASKNPPRVLLGSERRVFPRLLSVSYSLMQNQLAVIRKIQMFYDVNVFIPFNSLIDFIYICIRKKKL